MLTTDSATSKTWTQTLNPDPKKPGLWKTWTQKNLDSEKPGLWKTWTLENLDSENPGPWKIWTLKNLDYEKRGEQLDVKKARSKDHMV